MAILQKINQLRLYLYGYGYGPKGFSLHISSDKKASFMSLIGTPNKLDKRLKNHIDGELVFESIKELQSLKKEIDRAIRLFKVRSEIPISVADTSGEANVA